MKRRGKIFIYVMDYAGGFVRRCKQNCIFVEVLVFSANLKEFIIIIIQYGCLLSQAFYSWYFSWTSGDPHRSVFKLHIAVLSVLCVMFQV